jgi:hypothetical protein
MWSTKACSPGSAASRLLQGYGFSLCPSRRSLAWLRHEIPFPTFIRPPTPPGQADELALFLSSRKNLLPLPVAVSRARHGRLRSYGKQGKV